MTKSLVCDPGYATERQRILKLLKAAGVNVSSYSIAASKQQMEDYPILLFDGKSVCCAVRERFYNKDHDSVGVHGFVAQVVIATHGEPEAPKLLGEFVQVDNRQISIGCLTVEEPVYRRLKEAIIDKRVYVDNVTFNYQDNKLFCDGNVVQLDNPDLLAAIKYVDEQLS